MQEIWVPLYEFPQYNISNHGRIINELRQSPVRQSFTHNGNAKVGLSVDGKQYTRSVAVLVAETFLEGRTEQFDTPIHLDGDPRNCRADNLVYRPRWFAWKYRHQFDNISPVHSRGPVIDLDTKEVYRDVVETATTNGLLFKGVWRSIQMKEDAFPTWQRFDFVRD